MENIAPPLLLVRQIIFSMESGSGVKTGLTNFLNSTDTDSEFNKKLIMWWVKYQNDPNSKDSSIVWKSPYRQALINLIESGLNGVSVYENLCELEKDIIEACEGEISTALQAMPLKMLLPLLLFQFPSFLLLLLGPIFSDLLAAI